VKEKSLLRDLITFSNETIQRAYGAGSVAGQLLDITASRIFELSEKQVSSNLEHLGKIAGDVYDMIEEKSRRGIETDFYDLDDMLNGLQNGEMLIVAARPSMGKTAFAMNVVEQVAARQLGVGVFSLEMSKQQLAQRMMCSRARVDQQRVRKGQLSNQEYQSLAQAVLQMKKFPIFVDDSPSLTVLEFRTKARRLKFEKDIRLIVIDYLQLMDNPGPDSRQQQISEISRGIKAVARELEIPIICLSQLNRASEGREGHRPRMSDLRESGSIEQDADVVMLLHREDYYRQTEPDFMPDNIAEVIIAKQRNGPTGTVKLTFDNKTTTFKNLASQVDGI
jgi:replicative DNA helicase